MNSDQFIRIEGARAHNLKDVSLDIPRNELVVITGSEVENHRMPFKPSMPKDNEGI